MMFVDLFLIIVVDEIPTAQETAFPFSPRGQSYKLSFCEDRSCTPRFASSGTAAGPPRPRHNQTARGRARSDRGLRICSLDWHLALYLFYFGGIRNARNSEQANERGKGERAKGERS
jgi:hypothetical protein